MEFREYQAEIIKKGINVIKEKKFVYLSMEVRTGKTLTSLGILDNIEVKTVLFITKKKAIDSIYNDFELLDPGFSLLVVNYESLHKVDQKGWDAIVCDESHSMGAFPKPSKRAKQVKELIIKNNPFVIFLSGTPTPESFSQMYHQVYGLIQSPFSKYTNFYKFAKDYVVPKTRRIGGFMVNDYSTGKQSILDEMKPYSISYTQKEAGFKSTINEEVLYVNPPTMITDLCNKLKKDLVVEGKYNG